jgi:hypothetical protein
LPLPRTDPRHRLALALVAEVRLARPQDLPHGTPRHVQFPHDLLHRPALNVKGPPDPRDRVHPLHLPSVRCLATDGPTEYQGGQNCTPIPRLRGSKLHAEIQVAGVSCSRPAARHARRRTIGQPLARFLDGGRYPAHPDSAAALVRNTRNWRPSLRALTPSRPRYVVRSNEPPDMDPSLAFSPAVSCKFAEFHPQQRWTGFVAALGAPAIDQKREVGFVAASHGNCNAIRQLRS